MKLLASMKTFNADSWIEPGTIVYIKGGHNPFLLSVKPSSIGIQKFQKNDTLMCVSSLITHESKTRSTTYIFTFLRHEEIFRISGYFETKGTEFSEEDMKYLKQIFSDKLSFSSML